MLNCKTPIDVTQISFSCMKDEKVRYLYNPIYICYGAKRFSVKKRKLNAKVQTSVFGK